MASEILEAMLDEYGTIRSENLIKVAENEPATGEAETMRRVLRSALNAATSGPLPSAGVETEADRLAAVMAFTRLRHAANLSEGEGDDAET